jgi:hypothetical protein
VLNRKATVLVLALVMAKPCFGRVFLRWTVPAIPPASSLGVKDLVIPWGDGQGSRFRLAKRQGYQVYAEVSPEQAKAAAEFCTKIGVAGIFVRVEATASSGDLAPNGTLDKLIQNLRTVYPGLLVRPNPPGGKQADMMGTMVVESNGVLQVSSPTQQPWIDSNVALARFLRAYRPNEIPLISFEWNLQDSIEQRYGPPLQNYLIAVAEAGAFHYDVILPIHESLQNGLAQGNPQARTVWSEIRKYIQFFASDAGNEQVHLVSDVGVVTEDYDSAYEEMNLMARHNVAFRVIRPDEFDAGRLQGMSLIVDFCRLDGTDVEFVERFATLGGTVVLIGQAGNFPWHSAPQVKQNSEVSVYATGKGRVLEFSAPIADPDSFARDIWRLLEEPERTLSLWNALTVLGDDQTEGASSAQIDLVNYSAQPTRVQVQVKGTFSHIRYETPEHGCCISLTPKVQNGFTQFVVPQVRIGGAVHLSP